MPPGDDRAHWSPNQYRPVQEYTYKFTPNGELRMHVFYPFDWRPGERRGAIVFFFGGGWNTGWPVQFFRHAVYFASRGLVAASAEYRVKSRHAAAPEVAVEDARSAVRWLRTRAGGLGIDPERIVASGGSAGGHLAACTALARGFDAPGEDASVSPGAQALVLFNPALSFDAARCERFGVAPEVGRRISPVELLTAEAPPAALFFGSEDRMLPEAEAYVRKARSLGVRAELHRYDGAGHGFFNHDPYFKQTLRQADEFLASLGYLTGPPTFEP